MEHIVSNEEVAREILCEILEIEPGELREDAVFVDEYDADSLRAVEILASLERRFNVKIPESELGNMATFAQVKQVLRRYGWSD